MTNDPRDAIHQEARPLDRDFYDRDRGGEMESIASPTVTDGVDELGKDIKTISWDNPGEKYFQFQVLRDGTAIGPLLDHETLSLVDTEPGNSYTVNAWKHVPAGNEVGEYDRHRAMFWELYADYWNRKYQQDYARYYDSDDDAAFGGNARGQAWPDHAGGYPGYGTPADDTCPYTDAESANAIGGPVSEYTDSNGNLPNYVGEKPGWTDPKVLGVKVAEGLGRNVFEANHRLFDQSQEAFGAARGCYEVWTDVFVDITDGFRGGYQNGDTRWIFRTPLNEEYIYTENIIQEMYGMNGKFGWSTTIGTKQLPVDGMGETAHAVNSVSDHYYDWADEENYGMVVREDTRAVSDTQNEFERNYIRSRTKVNDWYQEEWIKGDKANADDPDSPEPGEIYSVTKFKNKEFMKETIKPGVLAGENGQVFTSTYGLEDSYHGGRTNEVFIGGQAAFSLNGRVSLEIAAYFETVIGLALEIFAGGKVELSFGGTYGAHIPSKWDFSPDSGEVSAVETTLAATGSSIKGGVTKLCGKIVGAIGDKLDVMGMNTEGAGTHLQF